jgi:hypothetical protein
LPLEDRTLPSTLTVTNLSDHDPGSLRDVLGRAAPGDTVTFAPYLAGGTITLTGGQLNIFGAVDIEGPGADQLAVSGNGNSRVFEIVFDAPVTMRGLTIEDGYSGSYGGGIYCRGYLTLDGCVVTNCQATAAGGGLYSGIYDSTSSAATLTVSNCTFSNNAAPLGGGVFSYIDSFGGAGTPSLTDCVVTGNSATQVDYGTGATGGGIYTAGRLSVDRCTVAGNTAYAVPDAAGNSGSAYGGGICTAGTLTLTNSTVAGNVAAAGWVPPVMASQ